MNKQYLIIVIFSVLLLTSCDPYGVNKDEDFQKIRKQLSENLSVNSIEIEDNKNLLIKVKSPFKENKGSFENFASVAQYIIGKNYKPNTLSMDKNIIIEMTDTLNNNYKSKTDFKSIFFLEKFFDKTLNNLELILNPEYNGKENTINEFHKTDCFKKIISKEIKSANIVGIEKDKTGKVNVIIIAEGNEEHYLKINYIGTELNIIKCFNDK
ncbi:hypothetical protein M4I21_12325 [Cellulophaga sp. 20_2_10]|uniref:hypothetical protein n=1 Tax=Cellulophaga sp. 20_2_10 TaxID=2942476 RepID=UPI00201A7747|nr:hypothetical protein [Cellulophaga sp. 20_2_10]MCL5246602.1 hypothetical protein [Cellulophaga sp. 20_2_10]